MGRKFYFDTRHDGTNGTKDQIADSDEVGQICVRFRRAKTFSLAERVSFLRCLRCAFRSYEGVYFQDASITYSPYQ